MKNLDIRILVISQSTADAEQICSQLLDEFDHVFRSVDEASFVTDFDKYEPDVIVLAFKQLEHAERCYLGLYRQSAKAHQRPHRTIVLCDKDSVRRAYNLCSRAYFDDYVMYWPMVFDSSRLAMSIIVAARSLDTARSALPTQEIAAHARQVASLGTSLDESIEAGAKRLDAVVSSVEAARASLEPKSLGPATHGAPAETFELEIGNAPTGTGSDLLAMETRPEVAHGQGEARLKVIDAQSKLVPMAEWIDGLRKEVDPHVEAARQIGVLAAKVPSDVLIVDDDMFQCKLLARLLDHLPCKLHFAHSGSAAMASLARLRPALILMDVALPDLDGVEITRRLKADPSRHAIPIVMITGHSERSILEASIKAGAIDFVVKPFERETLIKKVSRHLPAAT